MSVSKRELRSILLFDLYQGGHHVQYLDQLARKWLATRTSGMLQIVVHEQTARDERLRELIRMGDGAIFLYGVRPKFDLEANRRFRPVRNDLEHGRILKKMIRELAPSHCLCMYFDHVQLSLALNLRTPGGPPISGIYFRPSFHYEALGSREISVPQRGARILKRALLRQSLRNPSFATLFCLDPYVVLHLPRHGPHVRAVPLPDGVPHHGAESGASAVRDRFRIPADQKLGVLFGALDERKGIRQLLESALLLAPDIQSRLTILLSGQVRGDATWLTPLVEKVNDETAVRVILEDRFVPETEAADLFQASDFILAPYQRHVGSSNVVIRAAQVGRPVLGQEYGLMGATIREKRLGLAVDTRSPHTIAEAIEKLVLHPDRVGFDPQVASEYAAANTEDRYAQTILENLYRT